MKNRCVSLKQKKKEEEEEKNKSQKSKKRTRARVEKKMPLAIYKEKSTSREGSQGCVHNGWGVALYYYDSTRAKCGSVIYCAQLYNTRWCVRGIKSWEDIYIYILCI